MITQHAQAQRALRDLLIASIIALTTTLAPIVHSDTAQFFHTVFAGSNPTAVVRANVTK